jgi:hypothetical protein
VEKSYLVLNYPKKKRKKKKKKEEEKEKKEEEEPFGKIFHVYNIAYFQSKNK